ncbi:hypothetical protein QCM77_24315 [Bradyrhizobium sp. SSUT18]|uniref:hypothetical protein n=1 Tax=unclassified Bradyrhizobium TaxID=2631580 RepID=UPI00244CD2E1|nr:MULTISPECIES: hypothetical protein [unclassified Bradyrhizobium]MDH2354611.1 hypothetical protein [Bradyrhizobium sp. SSUT112]MDH2403056.1 hypothetical protein [Bradyrhizobium sp. SSUT18]
MKRILIGLIVAAVLAAGGWFGVNLYAQRRAIAEVEATFDQVRAGGGKASHGKIEFDLPTRTLTIKDIAVEPGQPSQLPARIAGVKAIGVRQIDDVTFSADAIEVSGIEFAIDSSVGSSQVKTAYNIPQATIRDYAGAIRAQRLPASNAITELYRFGIEQFSGVTASSIEVPTITVTVDGKPGTANPGGGDFAYSGLVMKNLRRGKVEATKADLFTSTFKLPQPGKSDKLTVEMSNFVMNDFDAGGMLATLDPEKANDASYHQIYRQISSGPYIVTLDGMRLQIDGFAIDDVGMQPSKFRMGEMLAALPQDPSVVQAPAQAREMMEKLAGYYEGLRFGRIEIGKTSMTTPQGTARINAIRYREGEFAIEGVDTPTPQGRFKMERFALKSFSAANLMRLGAGLSNPGQTPSPEQMLGLFRVLEGAEIKGVVSPFKNTRQLVTIDTISLNWGQLVGSFPSKANLVVKMVTPTDPSSPAQRPLIMAGVDKLAIDLDLGAAWTESSGAFALAPATIDLGNLARAQARLAFANVPRGMFTTDLVQAMDQAAQIETGAIELSLRDSGVVDLVVAQFSRIQNVSRDAARSAIVEMIRAHGEKIAASNLDARVAVDALAGFVETSGQTLSIKLTPLGKLPVLQLMDVLSNEPIVALAQFRIEASTGL